MSGPPAPGLWLQKQTWGPVGWALLRLAVPPGAPAGAPCLTPSSPGGRGLCFGAGAHSAQLGRQEGSGPCPPGMHSHLFCHASPGWLPDLPSWFIPACRHFFSRQAWHWFLWALSTGHIPAPTWHLQVEGAADISVLPRPWTTGFGHVRPNRLFPSQGPGRAVPGGPALPHL